MTDTLSDKLRQMVARNDDELDALWEAADRIEELETALHAIVCNTEPSAIKHRDYDHLAQSIYACARAALGEDKPFEDRWDNA